MKKLIITLIIIICAVASVLVLSWPTFGQYKNLSIEKQQKEKELKDLENYISYLQSISAQLKDFSPQLAKIDQALITDDYSPNLFNFVQKSALNSGVRLESIGMGKTATIKESKNILSRETNVRVSGEYPSLKNFIITLEKNARIIELTDISLSANNSGSVAIQQKAKVGVPAMDLNIKVYSYQN